MRKIVFTIKDEVCQANGKDVNATELLTVMTKFGSIEDYDKVVALEKAEYQSTIDSLNRHISEIADQKLTADEIKFVNQYRALKQENGKVYEGRIVQLENQLAADKTMHENVIRQISAVLCAK